MGNFANGWAVFGVRIALVPLVVVEAKSPYIATPMEDAVNQLQRYANRRQGLGVVEVDEGNEQQSVDERTAIAQGQSATVSPL